MVIGRSRFSTAQCWRKRACRAASVFTCPEASGGPGARQCRGMETPLLSLPPFTLRPSPCPLPFGTRMVEQARGIGLGLDDEGAERRRHRQREAADDDHGEPVVAA